MKLYEQETRLTAAFKTKKHAEEWIREQIQDDFVVDPKPTKCGDGWLAHARKLETIEIPTPTLEAIHGF